ncbi:Outer membrane receptor proteins, mostly Fe transport [Sinomicrobium oceani]|uniref:Outer membrane receptor proteins, mostly Fe transport n=2 Tax=Sinomicrobium oceani TaxID=1150368 RepID=A0A1K1MBL4_9FLAO|nr:Outer membrane receptor proteins, mostly Fe transport [Sinomicrobium oceani]
MDKIECMDKLRDISSVRLLLYIFVFPLGISAQQHAVKGMVKDEEGKVLSYVNMVLLQKSDSSVVSGTSTDDTGRFFIKGLKENSYILKASFIGFQSLEVFFQVNGDKDLGTLIMQPATEELRGVTLTSDRPLIERKSDRLVFNVENTSFSAQSSFDILRNTPGILLLNDQVLVRNSPAVVYINDKRVYLSGEELKSLLENYSGSNVRSVEVITTPPARYDAESGAIVNIVTSKSISIGYKGNVNTRWTEAIFPKYNIGTDHYFKNDFLDLFIGYSYNPRKEYKHDNSYFNFFDSAENPDQRWETDFERITRSYAHNVHAITDLTLNDKSSLSLSANIMYSPDKTYDNSSVTNIFNVGGDLESYFLTDGDLENDRSNLDFSLDYSYKMNEKGARMNVASSYIYYDDRQQQLLYTDYFGADGDITSDNYFDFLAKQRNNIFTQQLDLYLPSDWGTLETGLKYSSINSNSSAVFGGDTPPEDAESDRFKYGENIFAAYVGLDKEWGKWSASIGLRGEYTDVEANSIVLGEVNTQAYTELFPTVSIKRNFNENHQLGVSYKRSIDRPRYGSLNPYRYYLNERQYEEGNPGLTRAIDNKIAIDYTYKKKYIFSLYYQHTNNEINLLTFQDNENRVIRAGQYNIDEGLQYSLDFTYYAYVKKWWYIYTYMSAFYLERTFPALQSDIPVQKLNTMGYYGRVYNQFTLSKDRTFMADLSLFYISDYMQGSFIFQNRFSTEVGLTKKLWNNRVLASLNVADIFNTQNIWLRSRYQNQDNGYIARPETRTVSLSLKYNFGNYRLKDNERDTTPDEQGRLE